MAKTTRGLDAIKRDLEKIRDTFDMTKGIGAEICSIATDGIIDNLRSELDADGIALAPLSDAYAKWKGKKFPGKKIGELFGIMGEESQLKGVTRTTRDRAEVTYGSASGSSAQAMQEIEWFIEGNPRQPARDFWGITKEADQLIGETLDEQFFKKV